MQSGFECLEIPLWSGQGCITGSMGDACWATQHCGDNLGSPMTMLTVGPGRACPEPLQDKPLGPQLLGSHKSWRESRSAQCTANASRWVSLVNTAAQDRVGRTFPRVTQHSRGPPTSSLCWASQSLALWCWEGRSHHSPSSMCGASHTHRHWLCGAGDSDTAITCAEKPHSVVDTSGTLTGPSGVSVTSCTPPSSPPPLPLS